MPPDHPGDDDLRAYRDGRLAAADHARVEEHLFGEEACRRCAGVLDGLPRADLGRLLNVRVLDCPLGVAAGPKDETGPPAPAPPAPFPASLVAWLAAEYRDGWRYADRGTFGFVFHARHPLLGIARAVKWIPGAGGVGTPWYDQSHRVMAETKALAQLRHEHVVQVIDARPLDCGFVLVMEWLDGRNFEAWVREAGRVPVGQACAAARQVALGLHHAHTHLAQFVHRDVKPSNLFLTAQGVVKLIDFGIVKSLADSAPTTDPNVKLGTPLYMAPEQFLTPARVDHRADLYALGCTLYFLLAGRPPYQGSRGEVLDCHQRADIPDVRAARPDVPKAVAALVAELLAKSPDHRPGSADDVARRLIPFCAPLPGSLPAPQPSAPGPPPSPHGYDDLLGPARGAGAGRTRRAGALLVLVVAVALAGAAAWELSRPIPESAPPPAATTKAAPPSHGTTRSTTPSTTPSTAVPLTPTTRRTPVDTPPPSPTALFNRTDTRGWVTVPNQTAVWEVVDGRLTCRRGGYGNLVTDRANFADFYLRAKVSVNRGGEGGVFIRAGFPDGELTGYKVHLRRPDAAPGLVYPGAKLGELSRCGGVLSAGLGDPPPVGAAFTLGVWAVGPEVRVTVNDALTSWTDDAEVRRGHIFLGHTTEQTELAFELVEVVENPPPALRPGL